MDRRDDSLFRAEPPARVGEKIKNIRARAPRTPYCNSPRETNEDRKRRFDRYEMMWIATDEPHPRVPTRTGVVTIAASVPSYASEFVLLL